MGTGPFQDKDPKTGFTVGSRFHIFQRFKNSKIWYKIAKKLFNLFPKFHPDWFGLWYSKRCYSLKWVLNISIILTPQTFEKGSINKIFGVPIEITALCFPEKFAYIFIDGKNEESVEIALWKFRPLLAQFDQILGVFLIKSGWFIAQPPSIGS